MFSIIYIVADLLRFMKWQPSCKLLSGTKSDSFIKISPIFEVPSKLKCMTSVISNKHFKYSLFLQYQVSINSTRDMNMPQVV